MAKVELEVFMNTVVDTSFRIRRRHRSWPEALKREIAAASLSPGASVSVMARQYDVEAAKKPSTAHSRVRRE